MPSVVTRPTRQWMTAYFARQESFRFHYRPEAGIPHYTIGAAKPTFAETPSIGI
jgi:hypothetical protein